MVMIAAANSYMDFLNVDEGSTTQSIAGKLHRSKDPGAGAFTAYHSRTSTAEVPIHAGQELFVSYGNQWYVMVTDVYISLFLKFT
jgi:hypothetical protein